MSVRKLLALAVLSVLWAGSAALAAEPAASWTGWITDTHCGARGANKDHTAACVEKCMKTGKPQLWVESEKKGHDLDSFDKVKTLVGTRVTVKGAMDSASGVITVESAEKAAAPVAQ
jgi:hypothetical protein